MRGSGCRARAPLPPGVLSACCGGLYDFLLPGLLRRRGLVLPAAVAVSQGGAPALVHPTATAAAPASRKQPGGARPGSQRSRPSAAAPHVAPPSASAVAAERVEDEPGEAQPLLLPRGGAAGPQRSWLPGALGRSGSPAGRPAETELSSGPPTAGSSWASMIGLGPQASGEQRDGPDASPTALHGEEAASLGLAGGLRPWRESAPTGREAGSGVGPAGPALGLGVSTRREAGGDGGSWDEDPAGRRGVAAAGPTTRDAHGGAHSAAAGSGPALPTSRAARLAGDGAWAPLAGGERGWQGAGERGRGEPGDGGGRGRGAGQALRGLALCWPLCAALVLVYGCTLSIFPGVLAEDVHVRLSSPGSHVAAGWPALGCQNGKWGRRAAAPGLSCVPCPGALPLEHRISPHMWNPAAQHLSAAPDMSFLERHPSPAHNDCCAALMHRVSRDRLPLQSASLGSWYPLLLISAFNAADLLGKSLPCLPPSAPRHERAQPRRASALRRAAQLLSGPLRRPHGLMACAAARGALALPAFIAAAHLGAPTAVMAMLTIALGVSNGYLTAQVLTMGPAAVLGKRGVEVEGLLGAGGEGGAEGGSHAASEVVETLLVLSLVGGLNVGAFLGWLWLL